MSKSVKASTNRSLAIISAEPSDMPNILDLNSLLVLAVFPSSSVAFPSASPGRVPYYLPVQTLPLVLHIVPCTHIHYMCLCFPVLFALYLLRKLPSTILFVCHSTCWCHSMPENVLCNRSMTLYHQMSPFHYRLAKIVTWVTSKNINSGWQHLTIWWTWYCWIGEPVPCWAPGNIDGCRHRAGT